MGTLKKRGHMKALNIIQIAAMITGVMFVTGLDDMKPGTVIAIVTCFAIAGITGLVKKAVRS